MSIGSIALSSARFCGGAAIGLAGWGGTTALVLAGYGASAAFSRDEHHITEVPKDLLGRVAPYAGAAAVAALLPVIMIGLRSGAGRSLIQGDFVKSACANSFIRLMDAMVISQCVIDKLGDNSDFPLNEPEPDFCLGQARRDPAIRFHRWLLPMAAGWFALRFGDAIYRLAAAPAYSIPFIQLIGKMVSWGR